MSRRRNHFLRLLGLPAAKRSTQKELETHPRQCGGVRDKFVACLPGAVVRNRTGGVVTQAMSPEKRDRLSGVRYRDGGKK